MRMSRKTTDTRLADVAHAALGLTHTFGGQNIRWGLGAQTARNRQISRAKLVCIVQKWPTLTNIAPQSAEIANIEVETQPMRLRQKDIELPGQYANFDRQDFGLAPSRAGTSPATRRAPPREPQTSPETLSTQCPSPRPPRLTRGLLAGCGHSPCAMSHMPRVACARAMAMHWERLADATKRAH